MNRETVQELIGGCQNVVRSWFRRLHHGAGHSAAGSARAAEMGLHTGKNLVENERRTKSALHLKRMEKKIRQEYENVMYFASDGRGMITIFADGKK